MSFADLSVSAKRSLLRWCPLTTRHDVKKEAADELQVHRVFGELSTRRDAHPGDRVGTGACQDNREYGGDEHKTSCSWDVSSWTKTALQSRGDNPAGDEQDHQHHGRQGKQTRREAKRT